MLKKTKRLELIIISDLFQDNVYSIISVKIKEFICLGILIDANNGLS